MDSSQEAKSTFDIHPGDIELNKEGRIVISNPALAETIKAALEAEKQLGAEQRRRWNILCNINLNFCQRLD